MRHAIPYLRAIIIAAAIICLAMAQVRKHRVYDDDIEYGIVTYQEVSEFQLVEYATYSGVYMSNGRLILHERAARRDGPQPCPT